jgi:hypothetical protein
VAIQPSQVLLHQSEAQSMSSLGRPLTPDISTDTYRTVLTYHTVIGSMAIIGSCYSRIKFGSKMYSETATDYAARAW